MGILISLNSGCATLPSLDGSWWRHSRAALPGWEELGMMGGMSPIAPSLRLSLPSGAACRGQGGLSQPAWQQNNSGSEARHLGWLPGVPRVLSGLALLLRSCQGEGFAQEFHWSDVHALQFALFPENNLCFIIPSQFFSHGFSLQSQGMGKAASLAEVLLQLWKPAVLYGESSSAGIEPQRRGLGPRSPASRHWHPWARKTTGH